MKIRSGFVSNSSTTSFCIYGIYIYPKDVLESKIQELYEKNKDKDWCKSIENIRDIVNDNLSEFTDMPSREYEDCSVIGESPDSMPDDMIVGDWKNKVKKEIATWVGEEKAENAHWITDGWYDG